MHKNLTNNHIPTLQETIKYINAWIEFHNKNIYPNNRSKTIQEVLNEVPKQKINIQILDDLMMKTECRTINKHEITFLNMHYRSDVIIGIRDKVNMRYSLFDLSKIHVYSTKGKFLCIAHRIQKVHTMARILGSVNDMEEYKQQYKKQQLKNKLIKQVKKIFQKEDIQLLDIAQEEPECVEEKYMEKPK